MIMVAPRSYEVTERPGTIPERSLGDLLNETFLVYGRNLRRIIGLGAVLLAPVSVTGLILGNGAAGFVVEGVLWFPAWIFVYGVIVFAVGQQYVTGDIGIERCYSRVWWRVVSLAMLTLILFVSVVPGVGLFFLLVPLVLLLVYLAYWSVAVPAVMIEGLSSIEALRRSFRLVRGQWWRVFGIWAVVVLVTIGLAFISSIPFMVGDAVAGLGGADTLGSAMLALDGIVVPVVALPVPAIAGTLLYYDLRVRKEGFDMDSLSSEMGFAAV